MSKIFNQYSELKRKASNKTYLFRVGIFYIAVNEDAKLLNEKLGLKITDLGVSMYKVGFPISNKEKYQTIMESKNINYEFIDNLPNTTTPIEFLNNIEVKKILNKIVELDLNNITMIQSFNILCDLQEKLKKIK